MASWMLILASIIRTAGGGPEASSSRTDVYQAQSSACLVVDDQLWTFRPATDGDGLAVRVTVADEPRELRLRFDGALRGARRVAASMIRWKDGAGIGLCVESSRDGKTWEYRMIWWNGVAWEGLLDEKNWVCGGPLQTQPRGRRFAAMASAIQPGDSFYVTLTNLRRDRFHDGEFETQTFANHCPLAGAKLFDQLTQRCEPTVTRPQAPVVHVGRD